MRYKLFLIVGFPRCQDGVGGTVAVSMLLVPSRLITPLERQMQHSSGLKVSCDVTYFHSYLGWRSAAQGRGAGADKTFPRDIAIAYPDQLFSDRAVFGLVVCLPTEYCDCLEM